jgi:hypothetical protein
VKTSNLSQFKTYYFKLSKFCGNRFKRIRWSVIPIHLCPNVLYYALALCEAQFLDMILQSVHIAVVKTSPTRRTRSATPSVPISYVIARVVNPGNYQTANIQLRGLLQLLLTAKVVPGSLSLLTMKMEVIISYETSVATIITRRHIPEYSTLHSHHRENLKSYMVLTGWTLQRRRNVSCEV